VNTELTLAKQVVRRWKMHRHALTALADKLPESGASWRPWPEAMSTLELVYHLAWTPDVFIAAIEGRERRIPPIPSTLQEARALLAQLTKEHGDKLAGFDDTLLRKQTTITLSAGTITEPGVEILHRIIGHEAHHKGQLFTYARLLNVAELPFYVDLSV
jgi:uncharacterized damage-inducible protein DinB